MKTNIGALAVAASLLVPALTNAAPHPLEFQLQNEVAGGPPYPAAAIELLTEYPLDPISPGPAIPTELLSLSLNAVTLTPVGVQMQAKLDSADVARIDFQAAVPPAPIFPNTLFFDIFVDAAPHPDDPLAPVDGINSCTQPGNANFLCPVRCPAQLLRVASRSFRDCPRTDPRISLANG